MNPEQEIEIVKQVASDKELITFLKEFSEICPNYQDNCHYRSEGGKYTISYYKEITSDYNGKVHPTPTRINNETGEIQVNGYQIKHLRFKEMEMMYCILSNYCQKFTDEDLLKADLLALKIMDEIGMPADPKRVLTMFKRMRPTFLNKGIKHYAFMVKRMLNLCHNRILIGKWTLDETE